MTTTDESRARVQRLHLHRGIAVIKPDSVAIRPSRSALLVPFVQALLTTGAILLIVAFMNTLALWALMLLLLFAIVFGPIAVLGFVYNVAGTTFLLERHKQSARWQQGFLGLGLGTSDLVPFWKIKRIEVLGDEAERLSGGDVQDVVRWEIRLVKESDRTLTIGTVVTPRAVAHQGAERANRLAQAVAEMAGVPAQLAEVPTTAHIENALEGEATLDAAAPRRYRRLG